MRDALWMTMTGIGLLSATVVGLLGVQGRLSHEGTRGIPVVRSLFPPPEAGAAEPQATAQPRVTAPAPVAEVVPAAAAPAPEPRVPLFTMRQVEAAGTSAAEVNAVVARALRLERELGAQRVELARRAADLELREEDLGKRQDRLAEALREVSAERRRLELFAAEVSARVVELRVDEVAALQEAGRTLAALPAHTARDLLLDFWRTAEGQERAVEILAVMPDDAVHRALAELDGSVVRQILEKRMAVVRTGRSGR